jgi:hypothetical protein
LIVLILEKEEGVHMGLAHVEFGVKGSLFIGYWMKRYVSIY